jgi:hypothetical protein
VSMPECFKAAAHSSWSNSLTWIPPATPHAPTMVRRVYIISPGHLLSPTPSTLSLPSMMPPAFAQPLSLAAQGQQKVAEDAVCALGRTTHRGRTRAEHVRAQCRPHRPPRRPAGVWCGRYGCCPARSRAFHRRRGEAPPPQASCAPWRTARMQSQPRATPTSTSWKSKRRF